MDLNTLTKDELETMQIQKENEYQLALSSLETVEIQDQDYARKIAEIGLQRKNLATSITQGKYNVRRISSELRNIKTYIYKRLRGE